MVFYSTSCCIGCIQGWLAHHFELWVFESWCNMSRLGSQCAVCDFSAFLGVFCHFDVRRPGNGAAFPTALQCPNLQMWQIPWLTVVVDEILNEVYPNRVALEERQRAVEEGRSRSLLHQVDRKDGFVVSFENSPLFRHLHKLGTVRYYP